MTSPFRLVKPCPHCPFRSDKRFHLGLQRAREIAAEIAAGKTFYCHKTTIDGPDDDGPLVAGPDSQVCAGALATMARGPEGLNQMARIGAILGLFDPAALNAEEQPVYPSLDDWVQSYYHDAPEET